jgi:hypothetical protein
VVEEMARRLSMAHGESSKKRLEKVPSGEEGAGAAADSERVRKSNRRSSQTCAVRAESAAAGAARGRLYDEAVRQALYPR